MSEHEFQKFSSLTRFSHGWTVTEKIDGTNAQVLITEDGDVFTGSRNRWITPEADNHGFARYVEGNKKAFIDLLGPGRHYGEWYGQGIQRGYGLREKRFALFNVMLEKAPLPDGVETVPCLLLNEYVDEAGATFNKIMSDLREHGSYAAPFMDPEGIVMYHRPSGTKFKKTFDYDEYGKWYANKEARDVKISEA